MNNILRLGKFKFKIFDEPTKHEKFTGEESIASKSIKNGLVWLIVGIMFCWFIYELIGLIQMLV